MTSPQAQIAEPKLDPIAVTIKQAKALTGLSHDTIYKLMKGGRVRYTKIGRRTLLSYASLRELLEVHTNNRTHK